jgi:hypothetical protein
LAAAARQQQIRLAYKEIQVLHLAIPQQGVAPAIILQAAAGAAQAVAVMVAGRSIPAALACQAKEITAAMEHPHLLMGQAAAAEPVLLVQMELGLRVAMAATVLPTSSADRLPITLAAAVRLDVRRDLVQMELVV